MANGTGLTVGILWRGRPGETLPDRAGNRLRAIFDEFEARGARTEAILFREENADRLRAEMARLDAVLTWVDPIVDGRDRDVLDGMLRDLAAGGVYVSAHPDVLLKMGTKDVLVRTKDMEWGSDTHRVDSPAALERDLPGRLRDGARVLKQHRGSSGKGIWSVAMVQDGATATDMVVEVRHALRGSRAERTTLGEFVSRCTGYFEAFFGAGCIIDQPFQARVGDGMIRAYLSGEQVVGFGHQMVTALVPLPPGVEETPAPPPRFYFGPTKPEFQGLRRKLEQRWVREMREICGVSAAELPAVWDADFLLGPRSADGADTYVLCEINVSGVFPIPDDAVGPLVSTAIQRTLALKQRPA